MTDPPALQTVVSADGTTIAYERDAGSGAGPGERPALVIVTGAFNNRASSASLAAGLRGRFDVYRLDRRGRGDSGDTPPWSIAREVEDLAAVIAATGTTPFVYGHSSGAALALEAAAAAVPMRRLVAYEPPYVGGGGAHGSQADELAGLVAEGRLQDAVVAFLRGTDAPPGAIEAARRSPRWPAMVALAPTLPYDVRLANGGEVPVQRLGSVAVPVLAAGGGLSPDWALRAADAVAAAVPDGRARLVEAQTHLVTNLALLPVLTEFFV
jgi:pimeloyl-ACP methyl ester carboxylesterase